jgi:tripartite-type tricarboxylate transporter receptor subunit TctC
MKTIAFKSLGSKVLVLALAAMVCVVPGAYAKDYKGKTVTVLVGFNPGGGTDTTARLMIKYLNKHIAGNPNVIVQNMTGAAGIRALNYAFERAKPDGHMVLFAPISLLVPLLGEPGVRYQLDKFDVVGGIQNGPLVQFARVDSVPGGLKSAKQVVAGQNWHVGGIRSSSALDLMPRLAMDTLALKSKYITGYSNENTVRNAVQTSEVNTFASTYSGYKSAVVPTLVNTGTVSVLWQFPYRTKDGTYPRSKFAPDLPTFMEVHQLIKGKPPAGPHWEALKVVMDMRSVADNMLLAPPRTDPAALAVLRKGFAAALADPAMIAEAIKLFGEEYEVVSNDYIKQRLTEASKVNPTTLAFIKKYVADSE